MKASPKISEPASTSVESIPEKKKRAPRVVKAPADSLPPSEPATVNAGKAKAPAKPRSQVARKTGTEPKVKSEAPGKSPKRAPAVKSEVNAIPEPMLVEGTIEEALLPLQHVSEEDIRLEAYALYEERVLGGHHGDAHGDWMNAKKVRNLE